MPLTAEDRQAVHDLMVRYTYAADIPGPEEDLLALFTEDALMDSPVSGHYKGHEGVKAWLNRLNKVRAGMQLRHYMTNILIDGDGNRATLKAYFYETKMDLGKAKEGAKPIAEFHIAGQYDCVAVKLAGRWRLQRRTVYVDGK
jgi:hypothetical protein